MWDCDHVLMYRTTYLLFALSLLFGITYGMFTPTMPIFAANELHATYKDLGWIGAANFLPYVIVPLVMGIVLERISTKYLLTIGFATSALSMYLISTSTTLTELMLYSFLLGFAYSMIWPPAMHVMSQNPETRVKFTAIFTMCFVVGYMLGPLKGSIILDIPGVDHRTLFLIMSFMCTAGILSILLNYSHKKSKGTHMDLHLFKEVLKFPILITMLIYSTITFGLVLSLFPAFLQEHEFDAGTIMQLYAIFGVARIAGFLLSMKISAYRKEITLLSTTVLIIAMGMAMIGNTFVDFAIVMVLLGLGFATIYAVALNMLLAGSKKFTATRLVGIYESIFGIGWTVGPIASGYIGYTLGTDNLYLILMVMGMAVLLLTFLYRNKMQTAVIVLKYDTKSKKGRAIFIKQGLKNHLGVISMSIGMINRLLKNADKNESTQTDIAKILKTINQTKERTDQMLNEAKDIMSSQLIMDIRNILSKIDEFDPMSAGESYPDYDNIKKMLAYCTDRLDRNISDDAILK